jgi:hypothetical protein
MANLGFDPNQYEPTHFDTLPAGDYEVVVVESDLKVPASGGAPYLKLTLQVINGPAQNRKLFHNLSINHAKPDVQQIARGKFSQLCRAIGVPSPRDSSELHMKPVTATVKVKADQNGNPQNEVVGYKPRHAAPSPRSGFVGDRLAAVSDVPTGMGSDGEPW